MQNIVIAKKGSQVETLTASKFEKLYKDCGWEIIKVDFTFSSEDEKNQAWLERFGD